MVQIYHNPRCRKSREGLEYLKEIGTDIEIIEYLKNPLSQEQLRSLLKKLRISPWDLLRKNEAIWKEKFKGKEISEEELIGIMTENPKLIERPIVVKDQKAVVARPVDKIRDLFT
ncbi:arsenate reductase (glutaredoxin) [Robiginitalea sp. IMCC44478]|uniref:arsenate reductase (glutaredoxin) n=1 Tax=Robiginitalea sp. IMCC44478 TaxID=3459122 RepID=UPI004040F760